MDLQSLSPEQISEINELASKMAKEVIGKYKEPLDNAKKQLAGLEKQQQELWDEERKLDHSNLNGS